jgi:ribosomal protein S18 acetylase RimI-like enzyme
VAPADADIGLALRPAREDDRDLLLRIYAGTRADELAILPWTDEQKRAFVAQQFHAQRVHYERHYPDARHDIVLADGEPAGRLYVDRRTRETRVVDIALLPEFRNRGIGTRLLRALLDEAASTATTVSIHVELFSPARRLYDRLGFEPVSEHGIHLLMEWTPPGPGPS